jgi:septum formation protein
MEEFKVVLGSASPRRRELLAKLGVSFEVLTADVDEDVVTVADPAENVLGRAQLKANALRGQVRQGTIIITADTTVADGAEMLNKPVNKVEAWKMLRQLRGHTHQVHSGVIIIDTNGDEHRIVNSSDVVMRPYTDEEIEAYIATGDPMDKAGAYAIQHPDFRPVAGINGCYTGIMGLPLCDVASGLEACGVKIAIPGKLEAEEKKDFYLCSRCKELFDRNLAA